MSAHSPTSRRPPSPRPASSPKRRSPRDILHQATLRQCRAHEEIERPNEDLLRHKERLANDRDRKIAEIRREESSQAQRP